MAYIGHRCDCGHTDLSHRNNGEGQSLGGCTGYCGTSCGTPCGSMPEPEVFPTFDAKGRPVERVIEPGGGLPAMGDNDVLKTCPCAACAALYEQLVAA